MSKKLRVGELFAGIGGIGLGLENTGGFEVAWQVEKDGYASKVLAKNWPDVPRHDDVCTFPPAEGSWDVDLITAGFPCQDISLAGKGKGLKGERSGLFFEIIRIAGILRPRWLLLENVSALLRRGLGDVLSELASVGYDAEWHCLPAAAIGAPHRRDRIFILAHAQHSGDTTVKGKKGKAKGDACQDGKTGQCGMPSGTGVDTKVLADSKGKRIQGGGTLGEQVAEAHVRQEILMRCCAGAGRDQWEVEPSVDRVVDGFPKRVDRVRCLGNAVVPQVAQLMGEFILWKEVEDETN